MRERRSDWLDLAEAPELVPSEIHVWRIALDVPPERERQLGELLSTDERHRAERFHFDRHRRRFIACRGQVRMILGRYVKESPDRLRFAYSPLGKPRLDGGEAAAGLEFNVSHSHELALLAVGLTHPIGVDIEHLRAMENFEGLARRYFAPSERDDLASLAPPSRLAAFFRCWTRKEALLKATGKGLSTPLDQVVVTLGEDEQPGVVSFEGQFSESDWWLQSLQPGAGYVGALASPGGPARLSQFSCASNLRPG